jgi:hypothetical protein
VTRISRRSCLRGLGVALALPAFSSLAPRGARAQSSSASPRRFVGFFVPNGIRMDRFRPESAGALSSLPSILEPLADVVDRTLVVSGLDNFAATDQGDGGGDHARGTSTFLTATHPAKTRGADIQNGVSLDQLAAQALAPFTRFPSLELGCEGGEPVGECDTGYSCAYVRNIAWAGPATPLAKETNPRALFDRLFAGSDAGLTPQEREARRRRRRSILDFVLDDASRLRARLGATDRAKLDEYTTGVREVELRLDAPEIQACTFPARPDGTPADPEAYVRLMLDLVVLAMKCDLTRVATFMLGNGGSQRSYDFLGHPGSHHEYSHHKGDADNLAALEDIDRWEVAQLAYLMKRMREVDEVDGTMLDHATILFGSELADGNAHDHVSVPLIVGGGGGGLLDTGRHVVVPDGTPVANLFLSLLRTVGVERASFGDDGTEPLADVLL